MHTTSPEHQPHTHTDISRKTDRGDTQTHYIITYNISTTDTHPSHTHINQSIHPHSLPLTHKHLNTHTHTHTSPYSPSSVPA